tara:strand:- start:4885 stop:6243 length:1359 start_codon:yes stop_codon:yes gene_type:complete
MRTFTTYLFILLLFIPITSLGQTHTWTGNGGDTNWFNSSNWDVNSVPDTSSDVLIPAGFTVDITTSPALVDQITIESQAIIEVNNSIEITTGINILKDALFQFNLGSLSGNAIITNQGTFEITGVPNKLISQLTINNENLLLINESGNINLRNNMIINNAESALILVDGAGGAFSSNETGATLNNFGTLRRMDIGQFGVFYLLLTVNNYGVIKVEKSQNILILTSQNSLNNFETGILTGEGSFDITSPFTNNGRIIPDGDQGTELGFINTFNLSPQSIIELDIYGNELEEYDSIFVIDNPFIEGAIEVTLHYEAAINDEFTIITSTQGISGCDLPPSIFTVYQGVQYEFEVNCTFDEVILKVVDKILNVEEFDRMNLSALPNPNYGTFEIQFGSQVSEIKLTITNVLGQTLSTHTVQNTDSHQLTIDGAAGIYFITAKTAGGKIETFKVIKK